MARTPLNTFGELIGVSTLEEALKLAGEYASEHVQILTQRQSEALEKIQSCGALYIFGGETCVPCGDKVRSLLVWHASPGDRHESRLADSKGSEA